MARLVVIGALLGLVVLLLQRSDRATIDRAKEVDRFIAQQCEETRRLPAVRALQAEFPDLTRDAGWFFFPDDSTSLRLQYPVKWWNSRAIGERRLSAFTATPYAYVVAYRCGQE